MFQYDILPTLTLNSFQPHSLHDPQNNWVEKNCYIDLYIELVHAFNMEPLAMLPFAVSVDFAGDQWTFFKPQITEIRDLYGLDIQEMSLWRPLLEHTIEHLAANRIISVEVDAFWLPDTIATDYRKKHIKTTIAIIKLDTKTEQLQYFHNAGFYVLSGEDFRQIFRIGIPTAEDYLPPYAELIHLEHISQKPPKQLEKMSFDLLRKYVRLRPTQNPIQRYATYFAQNFPDIQEKGLEYYHLWAFNNTRQLGAAFDLASANLQWLTQAGLADFNPAITCFEKISTDNKLLILKMARAVMRKRPLDLSDFFDQMASDWDQGMQHLTNTLGVSA